MSDKITTRYQTNCMQTVQVSKHSPTIFVKSCMICGETVRELDPKLMEYHRYYGEPEICDKCKQAIMIIRKQLEEENEGEQNE